MEADGTFVDDRREEGEEPDGNKPADSQREIDAGVCILEATSETPHKDNHNILREIAQQLKRTPEDMEEEMQHTEGTALRAATLAGKEALTKGKSKQAVATVIESVGGDVCGRETWMCSNSILLAEAFVIGTRMERHGTPEEAADLQYMRRGDRAATAASPFEWHSSSVTPTRGTECGNMIIKKNAESQSRIRAAKTSTW